MSVKLRHHNMSAQFEGKHGVMLMTFRDVCFTFHDKANVKTAWLVGG